MAPIAGGRGGSGGLTGCADGNQCHHHHQSRTAELPPCLGTGGEAGAGWDGKGDKPAGPTVSLPLPVSDRHFPSPPPPTWFPPSFLRPTPQGPAHGLVLSIPLSSAIVSPASLSTRRVTAVLAGPKG